MKKENDEQTKHQYVFRGYFGQGKYIHILYRHINAICFWGRNFHDPFEKAQLRTHTHTHRTQRKLNECGKLLMV